MRVGETLRVYLRIEHHQIITARMASRKVTVPAEGPEGSSPALLTVIGLWPTLNVSSSVAVLLAGLGSVVPGGAVTVAMLIRSPLTRKTTELPAPAAMLTTAAMLLPEPLPPLVTDAAPVVLEVQLTSV